MEIHIQVRWKRCTKTIRFVKSRNWSWSRPHAMSLSVLVFYRYALVFFHKIWPEYLMILYGIIASWFFANGSEDTNNYRPISLLSFLYNLRNVDIFYNKFSMATQYCIVIGMEQICEMRYNFIFSHTCTTLNINCHCLLRSLMPLYLIITKTTIGYVRNCGLVWKTLNLVFDSVCMNEIS